MPQIQNITNRNFADLLSGEVQYIIPFFQRKYVWDKDNWNTLFQDIQEGILDRLDDGEPLQGHEHFFGPIVVRERMNHPNPSIKAFDVIDGQQRITTAYLMLAYFRQRLDVLRGIHPQAETARNKIGEWLENRNPRSDYDYDFLKIYSFKNDRLATWFAVRDIDTVPDTPEYREEFRLYNPNGTIPGAFKTWMDKQFGQMDASSIWRWAEALTTCLQVVWIPLKEKDNPQAIFESLNNKGTPLSSIDLLVNYLFRPIIDGGMEYHAVEALHSAKWLGTQTKIEKWGKEWRGNFEEYLRHLFSIGQPKMVGKGRRLYTFFKQHNSDINEREAREWLSKIDDSKGLYGNIIGAERFDAENPAIDRVLKDIRDTDMHSCRPFLFAVLRGVKAGEISAKKAEQILREVYTLLVRCKIVQRVTTQYDSLFPPLLNNIMHEPDMILAMHTEIRKTQFWVPNQEFVSGFVTRRLYGKRTGDTKFARLVLREIDKQMTRDRNDNNELPNYDTLGTVEHIAPQTATEEWCEETGCADKSEYDEVVPIHTIGNLCLRNEKANAGMGQSLFAEKQKSFANSPSVLAMEIAERKGPWNKDAIEQRSRDLAEYALKVWAWSPTNRG